MRIQPSKLAIFSQFLLFFTLISSLTVNAEETFSGHVIKVADGDTLTLQVKNRRLKIRLAEIDTPEKDQPYGNRSRAALVNKVMDKTIKVRVVSTDRYGRSIGYIYLKSNNINKEMIKEGHAWVYRKYSNDASLLLLEKQARIAKLGLWALPISKRQAPWEWRKNRRKGKKRKNTSISPNNTECVPDKRYCKHMTSCNDALFYLKQCGRTRMDGDKDGIPCETTHCRSMRK